LLFLQKETGPKTKSAFFEQGLNKVSVSENASSKESPVSLKLPPPPPSPVSPTDSGVAASPFKVEFPPQEQLAADTTSTAGTPPSKAVPAPEQQTAAEKGEGDQETVDDDFGDFQAAG
jgi:adaptin ear-binding coat-associated protein 1/2